MLFKVKRANAQPDMSLLGFAQRELDLLHTDDGYDRAIHTACIELLDLLGKQGHSGMSASFVLGLFDKLAKYQPLSPLTGSESEWVAVDPLISGKPLWQNKRCYSVFKESKWSWSCMGKLII